MDVNDDAGCLKECNAWTLIVSKLTPAGWSMLRCE